MKLLSSGNVAQELGVCRETVLTWIKRGIIQHAACVNGRYLITEEELNRFKNERAKKLPANELLVA